ncbi:MAG: DNA recombination protein RmuC [Candidatus Gastranaerophilaceae bacterium]|jgi:DNA recombination protein RmuC
MEILIFALGVMLGALLSLFFINKSSKNNINPEIQLKEELSLERNKVLEFHTKVAQLETKNETLKELADKQEEIQKKLTMEFENIASKILKENTTEFSKTNQKELDNILTPFKERIIEFEKKVAETRSEEIKDITSLKTEIKTLTDNNKKLSEDANNLASALKGQNKTQGNWGEVILERILEMSGLRADHEYSMQYTIKNDDGKMQRPDVMVHLPENRHIIIDSKVSLVSYENFYNAENNDEKQVYIKEFINSLKKHIKDLGEKEYPAAENINSPDFVLMFLPVEASFHLIFQQDNSLLDFAWEKKIVLVGPSTLLAALKTINLFWKQEKQTKNVLEIVKESGSMYDKFVGLLEDLNKTKNCLDSALNKLFDGNGNIIRRVENLKKLGAKTSKNIPADYFLEEEAMPPSL